MTSGVSVRGGCFVNLIRLQQSPVTYGSPTQLVGRE
jgi:hypothetical protein